jgi:plastocyanin
VTPAWQFSPRQVGVRCGDRVTVVNHSDADHTWTGSSWDSGNLTTSGAGADYSYTFHFRGNFDFVCSYHPSMSGRVVVS